MISTVAIANYFIKKSASEGQPIDNMKLQKLVYIAHGWYLATLSQPLIDATVEAWDWGPVISQLYHLVKRYGNGPIKKPIELDGEIPELSNTGDAQLISFLDEIWDAYKEYSGVELANMTHKEGSPWDTVAKKYNYNLPSSRPIDNQIIEEYYKGLKHEH